VKMERSLHVIDVCDGDDVEHQRMQCGLCHERFETPLGHCPDITHLLHPRSLMACQGIPERSPFHNPAMSSPMPRPIRLKHIHQKV
jgi:hypothetical protein